MNLVGEVDVTVREVGGAPAVDGRSDVLRRRDDDHGDDEEQHGEVMVQSVYHVVVVEIVRLEHLYNGVHQCFHLYTAQRDSDVISSRHIYTSCFPATWGKLREMYVTCDITLSVIYIG